MAALYASTWGDPSATKRALFVHGLSASSLTYRRIASEFASRGYFVVAPDLLGHGHARRGSDYTIAALSQELSPLVKVGGNDHRYDIVIGHSLGGIVAAALFPFLKSTQLVHVVLIDPPLEQPPESVAFMRQFLGQELRNPKSPEVFIQEWAHLGREDAILLSLSRHLCDVDAVEAILDQNLPWSFSHLLSAPPDNIRVTVLAADPSKGACVKEEQLEAYPHVSVKTACGISHLIPLEAPQLVVKTALEGVESQH